MTEPKRRTLLLVLLLAASFMTAGVAWLRLVDLRDNAEAAATSLALAKGDLAEIRRWRSSPGRAAPVLADAHELSRRLREAAGAAGLAEPPGSEPNAPTRVADSDYSEMSVYLAFQPLTLRQLTTFLHTLTRIDPSSRAKSIELHPPDASVTAAPGEELWRADVTVNYLTYTPRAR